MEIILDKDTQDELEAISKLLNGQLRGTINTVAREENLAFIQITMIDIYKRAIIRGYQLGASDKLEEKVNSELIEKIKSELSK